jgi:hypothetical protein
MSTNYPGSLDSYATKVDGVDDVMAAHINDPQDAIEALEAQHQTRSLLKVKNTAGATVAVNDVGYMDTAGDFKRTTTASYDAPWAVVVVGGANNAQVIVCRRGRVTVTLTANCSIGDFLLTSTTAGRADVSTTMQPEIFAVALSANTSGAGGTCEALLLTGTKPTMVVSSNDLYRGPASMSKSDFVATIATLPGGAVLTYNAPSSGDEDNIVPNTTSQLAKMVLHNTTRGDSSLIDDCVVGTNTVTLTADVLGTWQVGDTITMRSQTNTSNPAGNVYFADFEITSTEITAFLARTFALINVIRDTGAADVQFFWHPYESNVTPKRFRARTQVANVYLDTPFLQVPLKENRYCSAWDASGGNTAFMLSRVVGLGIAAP